MRHAFWLEDGHDPAEVDKVTFVREFGYVTNVYTQPAHRDQGIGRVLMQDVQQWARKGYMAPDAQTHPVAI